MIFRFLTAVGLGGEWGAASSLIYETIPHKRVFSACMIHTAAPIVRKFTEISITYLRACSWLPSLLG